MFRNTPADYLAMKHKAQSLPTVEVDEAEFVRLMVEAGETEDKAKFQAKISKGLGSAVMVGDKMLKIKD